MSLIFQEVYIFPSTFLLKLKATTFDTNQNPKKTRRCSTRKLNRQIFSELMVEKMGRYPSYQCFSTRSNGEVKRPPLRKSSNTKCLSNGANREYILCANILSLISTAYIPELGLAKFWGLVEMGELRRFCHKWDNRRYSESTVNLGHHFTAMKRSNSNTEIFTS